MESADGVNISDATTTDGAASHPDEGWTQVVSRGTSKRVATARKELQEFRERVNRNSNGVLCVLISKREERSVDGTSTFEATAFTEGILPLCSEIVRQFPFARPVSRNDRLQVWTDTVEQAKSVTQLTRLLSVPIIARCAQLEHSWTRITRVDRGFSEGDIKAALSIVGVTEVRRGSVKRRVDSEIRSFNTDRVLLRFSGVPPSTVCLAGREHKVTLHAGTPIACFKCQRLGHIAVNCKNDTKCIK